MDSGLGQSSLVCKLLGFRLEASLVAPAEFSSSSVSIPAFNYALGILQPPLFIVVVRHTVTS